MISHEGKERIFQRLQANDPTLPGYAFLPEQIKPGEDIKLLVKACQNNPYFRMLTLQCYGKASLTNEDVKALSTCRYLRFLDISGNNAITSECIQALADHPCLETVYIRGCEITHPGELRPFLENDIILDLRIAIRPSETEGEAIHNKLKANKLRQDKLREEIRFLKVEDVNYVLTETIQENPGVIEKLPKPLQEIAQKGSKTWEDPLSTGQTLAHNLSKLLFKETRLVAKLAEIFCEKYRLLREEKVKPMQFPPVSPVEQSKRAKPNEEPESYASKMSRYLGREKK